MQPPAALELADIVRQLISQLHADAEVSVAPSADGRSLFVAVTVADEARVLIGRNGQNLKALEHVVRAMWSRKNPSGAPVSVDVNDYRKTQLNQLVSVVHTTAKRVRETHAAVALDPMNPYERRIVHTELAVYHDIATESVGVEPNRRVVIRPI